jgi:glycosyltransferase involved in cell wall biosynthesis
LIAPLTPKRLAVFLATSGHSVVDRIMGLLLPHIASRGINVDLLHVNGKGPYLPSGIDNLRVVELGSSHSATSFIPLIRYMRRNRPDALLSDKDRVNQIAIIASKLAGGEIRVAVRFGQTVSKMLETRDILDKITHFFSMRYLYRFADAIVSPSEGAAQDLAKFAGLRQERVTVIPNPIERNRLCRLAEETIDHPWFQNNDIPVIVGLGELTQRKGFDTLIRAFSILRHERAARLVIIGKGSGKNGLEKLVREMDLLDDVHFPGYIANPFPYLREADLFVQASRYEGFGMALLEALALGIPSVATDCPSGPREILQDGHFGKLVPVTDVPAMAKAISQTLDAPPERTFVTQATLPYSIDKVADDYIKLLGLDE